MERKTFYSPRGNLILHVNPGSIQEVDGAKRRIGQKIAEFHPMGTGTPHPDRPGVIIPPYGCLTTTDPEIAAFLEKHREDALGSSGVSDVLMADEYKEQVIPKKQQISDLKNRNSDLNKRNMQLQSQLQEVLRDQGKLGKRQAAQASQG